jgi:hypothetical protein
MDARLRAIQAELAADLGMPEPAAEPEPRGASEPESRSTPEPGSRRGAPRLFPPKPAPSRAAPSRPAGQPRPDHRLEAMSARLVRAMQELLGGYELALSHVGAAEPGRRDEPVVTLAAGPFSGVAMLAEFERALRELPQVCDVAVRGYEGHDRAVVEVRLRQAPR